MRHISILCLLMISLVAVAQKDQPQYAAAVIPPELTVNARAVIREHTIDFQVRSAGYAQMKERRVVTLFSEKSPYDILYLPYDSFKKIGKITGKVYDGNGGFVREVEKSEISDESAISWFSIYEDSRVRMVDVNYHEYPYTVEFEYEMDYRDLLDYPEWRVAGFFTGVERSAFRIDLPQDLDISTRKLNLHVEPAETKDGGRRLLEWTVENIPPVEYEEYAPPASELLPLMLVSPHRFEARSYTGSMASWETFGNFMNQLMEGRYELSSGMRKEVLRLTADAASDEEKVRILYRYLQENMRYVSVQLGIGGWQPFTAKYVEERKYGDCKALSNFMRAMLKAAGIRSWPVLIYGGDLFYEVTGDFASPWFNHMILYVPGIDTWLECTSDTDPPGYLGAWTSGRNVLLVTEEGGQLARTPDPLAAEHLEYNVIRISLEADGSAVVDMSSRLTGTRQDWHRQALQELSEEELRKSFRGMVTLSGYDCRKLEITPSAEEPVTDLAFEAFVRRLASKAGKRLFIPLNACNQFSEIPVASEHRTHPVVTREAYREEDHITISIPEGYQVESMPEAEFSLDTSYGTYSVKARVEDGMIRVERNLEVHPVRLPAQEYGAWRDFFKEVAKMDGSKLVLVEKKT